MTANRRKNRWYIQVPSTSGEQDAFSPFTFQPTPHPLGEHLYYPLRNKFELFSSCNGYQALNNLAFFIRLSHLFDTFWNITHILVIMAFFQILEELFRALAYAIFCALLFSWEWPLLNLSLDTISLS